ncbi:MAG: alpha/beta hydrolase [Cyclobacteriaceae bacterium]
MNCPSLKASLVNLIIVGVLVSACSQSGGTQRMATRDFEFISGGKKLSGIIDYPTSGKAKGIVLFVHGSGNTNIREDDRYFDLRSQFVGLGLSCVMWDKPGQGRSEGMFSENQPIESSAKEVTDAISWLQSENTPGIETIGLWSTSRGCWVAPLVLSQHPGVKFWIAIGGVPAEDNKYYLMKSNLPLEGHTDFETVQLMKEWTNGRKLFFSGGDYSSYLAATANLRKSRAVRYLAGDLNTTEEEYYTEQEAYLKAKEQFEFDKETYSLIRVRNFDQILKGLNVRRPGVVR